MELRIKAGDRELAIDFISTRHIGGRKGKITDLHAHPVFHLMFITEGEGRFRIGDTTTVAKEGMLYIIDPNVPHQFYASDNWPLANFESTFLLLDDKQEPITTGFADLIEQGKNNSLLHALRETPIIVPQALQALLVEGFQKVIDAQKGRSSAKQREVTLMDLMFRIEDVLLRMSEGDESDRTEKASYIVLRLKQLFQMNLHRNVTLHEMALLVHLTPNYLCRLFKRETGMPLQQFFLHMKLEEAIKQMLYTDLPIYLVADQLGFENATYFTRFFRARTGLSPSEYRKRWTRHEG